MSKGVRPQNGRRGPQLPYSLQQKLGLPQNKKRYRTQVTERHQKPQAARPQQHNGNKRRKVEHVIEDNAEDEEAVSDPFNSDDDVDLAGAEEEASRATSKFGKAQRAREQKPRSLSTSPSPPPMLYDDDDSDDLSRGSREYSPEVVLDASSKTFQDRQADEDDEIAALERKLGMRGKRNKKVFDDGFDELLGGLEDAVDPKRRKKEEREWLEKKRQKAAGSEEDVSEDGEDDDDDDDDDNEEIGGMLFDEDDSDDGDEEFGGFDDEENTAAIAQRQPVKPIPVRENPYVAPTTDASSSAKYIPPSRRNAPETDTELVAKLRRQAQGSLNRLSEANIISIVDEFDRFYQTNPRQEVTSVIIDLVLTTFTIPSTLQNTFIILHAAFLAALYKLLGADFAAEVVSRLIETFDKCHNDPNIQGKGSLNLISLLANLFTFGVVSSTLIFDHIKLLLSDFGENSAELLLRIVRDCGPQLRSDDPTALKGIVQMMNDISAQMTSKGQPVNVRTRVMMDTITDLKNNKTRQATNAAGITGEHLTRMRKALGSLNTRQLRGTEPLGITRSDILHSDKKGKWWLVGASWKGHAHGESLRTQPFNKSHVNTMTHNDTFDDVDEIDIPSLLSHLHLPTPTARSIFIALTTATDPPDALSRLSKLRLTKRQEPEIPRVLIRVCRAESSYNPYYAAVARLLLMEKKYKMSFQIALWKFFGQLGESQDDEDDENGAGDADDARDNVQPGEIANVARMYAMLICKRALDLNIIKTLNIGFTKENATLFLELLLVSIFTNAKMEDENLVEVFSGVEPRLVKSLQYFLDKHVRKTDLVSEKRERRKVKHGCKMAEAAFTAMEGGGLDSLSEDNFE